MPVLPSEALYRRDASPGRTFSIIFAVVAFLVILGCLVLVIILPKLRRNPKSLPGSRYPVVPNYPQPFGPPPRFPSHPALLRGFRKQLTSPVQRYNPTIESPFPNGNTQLDRVSGPSHSAVRGHGLFTPPQGCFNGRRQHEGLPRRKLRTAARVAEPDPRQFTTFSAKHNDILPVPEPLVLKARPAGRPPPLTRQLERFPMPLPLSSIRKHGLVHPAKLFQDMEQRHRDTIAETLGTPCPGPQKTKQPAIVEMSLMSAKASCACAEPIRDARKESYKLDHTLLALGSSQALHDPALQSTNSGEVERSEQVNQPKHQELERMGTLTRPKTPVAERRNWFDRAASDATKEKSASSRRLHTPASNPFTTPGLASTPPTSPGSFVERTPLPSTPSRPNGALPCMNLKPLSHRRTPSSTILPSTEKLTALPLVSPSDRTGRTTRGSGPGKVFKKRSNTGRLKLVSWSKLRPNARVSRRYSSSSLSTIFKPILGPRSQCSQGASSVCSRDANRVTLLEAMRLPVQGSTNHQAKPTQIEDLPSSRRSGVCLKQSASTDHLKTKIDNWDLHTGNLDKSMLSPASVKRSISDTGPRRTTRQGFARPTLATRAPSRSIPIIQIGRSSDDVFGLEADGFRSDQTSIVLKRMGRIGLSPIFSGGLERGTAPGGGDWI